MSYTLFPHGYPLLPHGKMIIQRVYLYCFSMGIKKPFHAKNKREIKQKGVRRLIKGVNRQVVEITQTQCEYFEKVLFFIKPEYSAVSEGDLKERATIIAQSAGMPPAARLKKSRVKFALSMSAAACGGAVVSGTVFLLTSFF